MVTLNIKGPEMSGWMSGNYQATYVFFFFFITPNITTVITSSAFKVTLI